MSLYKRIVRSPAFLDAAGAMAAGYLRLVWHTCSKTFEPATIHDTALMPAIITMWHGQHFLAPFVKRDDPRHRAKVLISRHRDGELNARAAKRLGIGTIRGSGAHNGEFHRKGGAVAFTEMLEALAQGYNVALTADVPKISRVAGLGIVKLAQYSGRPIYAAAIAGSEWTWGTLKAAVALRPGAARHLGDTNPAPLLHTCRRPVSTAIRRAKAGGSVICGAAGKTARWRC